MRFFALLLAVLFSSGLAAAAAHPCHGKRDMVIVTVDEEVIDVVTETIIITLEPGQHPPTASAPVASSSSASLAVPTGSTSLSANGPGASSSTASASSVVSPDVPASSTPPVKSLPVVVPSSFQVSVSPTKQPSTTLSTIVRPSSLSSSVAVSPVAPSSAPASSEPTSAVAPSSVASSSAAPSSATSSSAAPSSTAPTSGTSGKRGLAYNDASLTDSFSSSSEVSWAYNWGASTSAILPGLEFVPMLWGNSEAATLAWPAAASAAIAAGSQHLLAFNEPDNPGQADMTYTECATAYKQYMQPFAGKAKLGAPAVTNAGSPAGLTFLTNFLNSCDGCQIDFVPIHWYDSATNFGYFQSYIEEAYKASGGRPLWITEFGASGSDEEQNTFLETVMPWLDSLPYVERYAYFMVEDNSLISSGTSLSALGSTYESFTSNTISSLLET